METECHHPKDREDHHAQEARVEGDHSDAGRAGHNDLAAEAATAERPVSRKRHPRTTAAKNRASKWKA